MLVQAGPEWCGGISELVELLILAAELIKAVGKKTLVPEPSVIHNSSPWSTTEIKNQRSKIKIAESAFGRGLSDVPFCFLPFDSRVGA